MSTLKKYSISLLIIFTVILFYIPFFQEGMIVFSDIAVGVDTKRYMEEILGLWNNRYNTTTLLNLPRLIIATPSFLISLLLGAEWMTKSFVIIMTMLSFFSQFHFTKHLFNFYLQTKLNKKNVLLASYVSGLIYCFNPWIITRIQHTYLLCGYALFPLLIHFYFKIFNPKYKGQKNKIDEISDYLSFAALLSVASAAIHYFFFILIAVSILILSGLIKKIILHPKDWITLVTDEARKIFILSICCLLSCYYWLFPYVYTSITGKISGQANINVEDTLLMFSRNSGFWNVMTLKSYWWSMMPEVPNTHIYNSAWCIIITIIIFAVYKFFRHYDLIKLFSIFSVFLIVLSTGTYYPLLAPIHEFMVFKIPLIGNIFRDPNKTIGLLAFLYASLLSIGFSKILELKNQMIKLLSSALIFISIAIQITPYYKNFINNLYSSTQIPQEVLNINSSLNNNKNKVIYLPQAENRVNHKTKIAETNWNPNIESQKIGKSIGDIYVYGTKKDTSFQHEGNSPLINYTYNFLIDQLDNGRSLRIESFLSSLYADQLVFQTDFKSFQDKEKFNLELLKKQKNLALIHSSPYASIYNTSIKEPRVAQINKSLVATPYGLDHFNLLHHIYDEESDLIYTSQTENNLAVIDELSLNFDYRLFQDLFLSLAPDEYILKPFDHINRSAPFLGWAKTSLYKHEWFWFMKSMNLDVRDFPVERSAGVVATFAAAELKAKSYQLRGLKGTIYKDLNSLLNQKDLFLDNEDTNIQVQVQPKDVDQNSFVLGSISPGVHNKTWKVAKTKSIKIKPAHPYSILTNLSGRNAINVHIKATFYDKDRNELGVTYISRPEKLVNFNAVEFKTFFTTPAESERMQISILSDSMPQHRIFWWLHQFKIEDLGKYKAKNQIKIPINLKNTERHTLFAKVFNSPNGGDLNFTLGETSDFTISTKSVARSNFSWRRIGDFKPLKNKDTLIISNLSGFNSIGDLIAISYKNLEEHKNKILTKIKKSKRSISLEAELHFEDYKALQSQRNYPYLSGGKGVYLKSKTLKTSFSIEKTRDFTLKLSGLNLNAKDLDIKLLTANKTLLPKVSNETKYSTMINLYTEKEEQVIKNTLFQRTNPLRYKIIKSQNLSLKKGMYQLQLSAKQPHKNLTNLNNVKPLYVSINPIKEETQKKTKCCQCAHPDHLKDSYRADQRKWSVYSLNSCQWHILQTNIITASTENEYSINYKFKNNNNLKSHQKIIFLNSDNVEIGKKYIPQNEIDPDLEWITKDVLITPPKETRKMILLFLFKGKFKENSSLSLKDLFIVNQSLLPLIDYIHLSEVTKQALAPRKIILNDYSVKGPMEKSFSFKEAPAKSSISINQPLHKIWSFYAGDRKNFLVNGIFHSTPLRKDDTQVSLKIALSTIYWIGLSIHIILLLSLGYFFIFIRRRD